MDSSLKKSMHGFKLYVEQDEYPMNPRKEWDNVSVFAFFHNRYTLGDENSGIDDKDYNVWGEMEKAIMKKAAIVVPVYMYDHSGITIRAGRGFGDIDSGRWDWGQIGFAFITKAKMKTECPVKGKTEREEWARKVIDSEVKVYDEYLRGDVYEYRIEDEDGDIVDSCSGMFGDSEKDAETYAEEEGLAALKNLVAERMRKAS